MTAGEVAMSVALGVFDFRKHVIVPNCQLLGHEADLTVLQPSGWAEEVEVKVSVADFRRDFTAKAFKHKKIQCGDPVFSRWTAYRPQIDNYNWDNTKPHLVRRFWFAVPADILGKVEPMVPDYAGVISVEERLHGRRAFIVRKAPNLKMARKFTDAERIELLRLAYTRYWSIRFKLNDGDRSLWEGVA